MIPLVDHDPGPIRLSRLAASRYTDHRVDVFCVLTTTDRDFSSTPLKQIPHDYLCLVFMHHVRWGTRSRLSILHPGTRHSLDETSRLGEHFCRQHRGKFFDWPGRGKPATEKLRICNTSGRLSLELHTRPLQEGLAIMTVGFCGAYTTFSSFSLDNYFLVHGKYVQLAVNMLGSLVGAFLAVWAGWSLSQMVFA